MRLFGKEFGGEYRGPPPELLPPEERAIFEARAARRTVRLLAVGFFVLVVGAVFAYTVRSERTGNRDSSRAASSGSPGPAAAGAATAADASIGPAANSEVGLYLDSRRQALATATGERVAVVSLDAYLPEAEARAKVGSLPVDALLAAAPGAHPSVVTTGLEAWAEHQRRADTVERDEIAKLLPTVTDKAFKQFYESEIVRLDTAIESVSPASPVVFGLVVRAPADTLRTLATTAGVRLVDVGDGPTPAPGATYRGVRPEETTKVGQPATRPV